MRISTFQKPTAPALFASIRGSRDLSLIAFGAALLTAAALQLGAFLPRLDAPAAHEAAPAAQVAATVAAPAAVVASQPLPCTPRG